MVCSLMPDFAEARGQEFRVSSREWDNRSNHHAARQHRLRRQKKALEEKFDVQKIETDMPTAKTCRVDCYREHIKYAAEHFQQLYEHYQPERWMRWKTYRCEQRALHELCMRVKGDRRAKRSSVVVAYGAAQFGATMRGKRAVPVKKFREHLGRYVTVVPVDEFRTSRVCSHQECAVKPAEEKAAAMERGQTERDAANRR